MRSYKTKNNGKKQGNRRGGQNNLLQHYQPIYRPIRNQDAILIIKEQTAVAIAAGGPDTNVWVRPTSQAYGTSTFTVFSSGSSSTVFSVANYYDLVSYPSLKCTFQPAFHTSSGTDAYTQNEVATTYVVPGSFNSNLIQFQDARMVNPLKPASCSINPMSSAKAAGIPEWLPALPLGTGSVNNYSYARTILFYFPAPIGSAIAVTTQVGTLMIESVIHFKGRNS